MARGSGAELSHQRAWRPVSSSGAAWPSFVSTSVGSLNDSGENNGSGPDTNRNRYTCRQTHSGMVRGRRSTSTRGHRRTRSCRRASISWDVSPVRLRRPFLRSWLPPELLLQRLDHELHDRRVVRHAVQLEPAVKLLRDAGRQLRPGFVCRRHLRRLGLRARCPPRTTATPATATNGLRLRGYGHRPGFLRVRHPLGYGLRRTTGTTWAPLPSALPAPTGLRRRLPRGDAAEQRLDREADFLLNQVTDHRHEA